MSLVKEQSVRAAGLPGRLRVSVAGSLPLTDGAEIRLRGEGKKGAGDSKEISTRQCGGWSL